MAVSYTHRDVYKRQVHDHRIAAFLKSQVTADIVYQDKVIAGNGAEMGNGFVTVSYTHLAHHGGGCGCPDTYQGL